MVFLALTGIRKTRAATFNVLPSIVFISPSKPIVELKITNEGDDKITFEAKLYSWALTPDGKDDLTPASDIAFFPRIFSIDGHQTQIVRIGIENPTALAKEKSYRIFVRQLPSKIGVLPGGVQMVVNVSVPIFVLPSEQEPAGKVENITLDKAGLNFTVSNTGNVHFMEHLVDVVGFDAKKKIAFQQKIPGWYVLSGETRNYHVDVSRSDCEKAKRLTVVVVAESPLMRPDADVPDSKYTSITQSTQVAPGMCGATP